jgi:hypothetical protein
MIDGSLPAGHVRIRSSSDSDGVRVSGVADFDGKTFGGLPVLRFSERGADNAGRPVAWELCLDKYDEHHMSREIGTREFAA